MKIAVLEPFPILEWRIRSLIQSRPYSSRITLRENPSRGRFSLLISDRNYLPRNPLLLPDLILTDGSTDPNGALSGELLTGGMKWWDTVTFSSIGEDRAVLCLQRELCCKGLSVVPFEKPVPYRQDLTLYQNLAADFCICLAELTFGEEL